VGELPLPCVYHFDGVDACGATVLTHERRWGLRDRYGLEVRPDRLDPRLAIALAVCLDAMQSREGLAPPGDAGAGCVTAPAARVGADRPAPA
jgi:hypothetical protein